ncbi:MAG: lipoyl(octanoyl) transferase LipB [Polyangia bacterium]
MSEAAPLQEDAAVDNVDKEVDKEVDNQAAGQHAPPELIWLGRAPYSPTWALQEQLRRRVLGGGREAILLCEHPPVLTLGRSAQAGDVLALAAAQAAGVEVVRTSRGGQVTYHGPGQLVVYPVVRLRRGVLRHIEWLAAAAVAVAAEHGIAARFERARVGVWVGDRKLAALGVHVERRVAVHGLALNVTAEASAAFRRGWFVPCGLAGGQVTSLEESAPPSLPCGSTAAGRAEPPSVRAAAARLAWALLVGAGVLPAEAPTPHIHESTVALLSQALSVE